MSNGRGGFTAVQLARFAEAIVGALGTSMVVLDQRLTVLAASPAFLRLLTSSADPRGQELLSLVEGRWDVPELRQALEDVLSRRRPFDDVKVLGPRDEELFVSGRLLHAENGQPELITVLFEEAETNARTETHLHGQGLAEDIVASIRHPLIVLDYRHRVKLANQAFYRVFRISREGVEGRLLGEIGNRQWDIPELRHALEEYGFFNDFEVERDFDEIGPRTMLLNARRIDHLRLILLSIEDVTERKRQESQREMLVAELAHRVKNLLAVVQSLASQTRAGSIDEFRSAFVGRLAALATAHEVLLESQWRSAELGALLHQILAPHTQDDPGRVQFEGPPVTLSTEQVTAFAVIVHELATNAAKYGALSSPSGRVAISWVPRTEKLWFEWHENGGPPVQQKQLGGFGTILIERMAAYQLRGQAELKFEPTGLRCQLEAPLGG